MGKEESLGEPVKAFLPKGYRHFYENGSCFEHPIICKSAIKQMWKNVRHGQWYFFNLYEKPGRNRVRIRLRRRWCNNKGKFFVHWTFKDNVRPAGWLTEDMENKLFEFTPEYGVVELYVEICTYGAKKNTTTILQPR